MAEKFEKILGDGQVMIAAIEGFPKLDISVENLNTGLSKGDKCQGFT